MADIPIKVGRSTNIAPNLIQIRRKGTSNVNEFDGLLVSELVTANNSIEVNLQLTVQTGGNVTRIPLGSTWMIMIDKI